MKKYGKLLLLLLLSICLITMSSVILKAFNGYKVTVSGGLYGKLSYKGGEKKDLIELDDQTSFNPNDFEVTVTDDRFYFKGFHLSGIEGALAGAQELKEDSIYVASFGMKGDLIEYYVEYVDEEGHELHPKRTLHGNEGDKPVIAYEYIDGYLPQTYNFTGTLKKGETLTFTFVYKKAPAPKTIVIYEGTYTTSSSSSNTQPSANTEPVQEEETFIPEEIIDIDEKPILPEENTNTIPSPTEKIPSTSIEDYILPAGIGIAAGGGLLALLLGRKKEEE
ncbi:MAG: MucBP domain-containing protein [Erysipelotrichaceae bacterium]|nr:MucBP domain-containing protein [Erysipelotrichaceae bacterium]